ncbi:MAG: hypothetical protein A2031_10290 [Deltaproteobacteria bacterium RBG_19FT_COMBO_43_11]|nr:MAG: hypothetical protein A2031_10290 [Deltaproteobacteria bacterium RBG_19FT_COMBO_43_11]
MGIILVWVLGIATILGGIAAIGYFRDKWREKQNWSETEEEVNDAWWQSSELKKNYEAQGFTDFSWSNSSRVAERILEGKEIVYGTDKKKRIKTKFVNKSGQILLCRKRT